MSQVIDYGKSLSDVSDSSMASQTMTIPHVSLSFPIKLDRCNYLIWIEKLLSVISTYKVEEYVDETVIFLRKYLFGSSKSSP